MSTTKALITAHGLRLCFGGREVLHDVNLSIKTGEIVTIVGPNGSGKSTLLKCLIGAEVADAGKIERKPGLKIGYVPQKLHLDPVFPLTVHRFLRLAGERPKIIALRADKLGISTLMEQQLASLSGGQLQRVLLASALVGDPDILILDEAAQGLDQPAVTGFYQLIEEVRREMGCAVLMVSHDLHVVMSASDRVLCLNGHICCEGTPTVVSAAPEYRQLFGYGTEGTLALYRHVHDHKHENDEAHDHD